MVAPGWEPCGRGRFYFYEVVSIEYAVHRFYSELQQRDDSKMLHISGACDELRQMMERRTGRNYFYSIPVLQRREFDEFRASVMYPYTDETNPSRDEEEQYQLFLENQLTFERWKEARDGV